MPENVIQIVANGTWLFALTSEGRVYRTDVDSAKPEWELYIAQKPKMSYKKAV